jgi:hypothetical protein
VFALGAVSAAASAERVILVNSGGEKPDPAFT